MNIHLKSHTTGKQYACGRLFLHGWIGIAVLSAAITLTQFGCSAIFHKTISGAQGNAKAAQSPAEAAATAASDETGTHIVPTYGKLPMSFEANEGQSDKKVKFLARGRGYTLFLTDTEAVLSLRKPDPKAKEHTKGEKNLLHLKEAVHPEKVEYTTLRMKLEGAASDSQVSGLEALPGKVNYFIGNDATQWQTNIPTYAKVQYSEVYPGIDLVYYGDQGQLEYDLVVQAGADPNQIKLAFEGMEDMKTDEHGDLILTAEGGALHLKKPRVYQEANGTRQPVAAQYVLQKQDKVAAIQVGVKVAAYDVRKPLIIDPVLSYSTYLGGSHTDYGVGIAVDGTGNAYVVGVTNSIDFPTGSPLQSTNGGGLDAFVTKLNSAGSALVYLDCTLKFGRFGLECSDRVLG